MQPTNRIHDLPALNLHGLTVMQSAKMRLKSSLTRLLQRHGAEWRNLDHPKG